jgi:diguanylate cyclase (GGDEF)-like protein/PAS domain S-box-containing protein
MFSLDPEIVASALGNARLATWEWIASSDTLRWTSGQAEIYSRPSREINCTAAWQALIHPDDAERVQKAVEVALANRSGFREQFRVRGEQGKVLWIFGHARVLEDADGTLRMVGMNMDVTDWVDALASAESRFTATFEQAAVGIAHVGTDGRWLNVNQRCCEILGYSLDELKGLTFADITHPEDVDADWKQVRSLLAKEQTTYSMEKRYFRKDRRLVWVNLTVSLVLTPSGLPDYFISVIEDITARKELEAERDELIQVLEQRVEERTAALAKLTMTDPLTGIANRRRLDEQLRSEWDRAVRNRSSISVVLIDVDHFKGLNDGLGHAEADRILVLVATELTAAARRPGDLAVRFGGDEFLLVLPDTNHEGALTVAKGVEKAIDRLSLTHPGSMISSKVTISQGVATARPTRRGSEKSLILAADRALYVAKESGRNRICSADSRGMEAHVE